MKKIIGSVLGIAMVVVIVYHAILSRGILNSTIESAKAPSSTEQSYSGNERTDLTQFEMNAMAYFGVGDIIYEKDTTQSWGYSVKVLSHEIIEGISEIPEIEGSKERLREMGGASESKETLIINIEITNVSAEKYFRNNAAEMCLGNNTISFLNDFGGEIESTGLIVCTNDRNNPNGKSGWMYPLEKNETYTGKLVYIIDKEKVRTSSLAFIVNMAGALGASKEKKMIILKQVE